MTKREITRALAQLRRAGVAPGTLREVAVDYGCSRATMTRALSHPRRYARARSHLEAMVTAGLAALADRTSAMQSA